MIDYFWLKRNIPEVTTKKIWEYISYHVATRTTCETWNASHGAEVSVCDFFSAYFSDTPRPKLGLTPERLQILIRKDIPLYEVLSMISDFAVLNSDIFPDELVVPLVRYKMSDDLLLFGYTYSLKILGVKVPSQKEEELKNKFRIFTLPLERNPVYWTGNKPWCMDWIVI